MKKEWKVYIKGVQGRGDEVRQALINLGGKVTHDYCYDSLGSLFFINHYGEIKYTDDTTEIAKIIMDNYHEIKLPEKWEDGDILVNKNADYKFCVFDDYLSKTGSGKDLFFFYCEVARHKGEKYLNINNRRYFHDVNDYRLATTQEVEQFHEALHKYHKEWDAEKKQLIDWNWKPKEKETYWLIRSDGHIGSGVFRNDQYDNGAYNFGNCFKTKEEAESMAEKIKHLLTESKYGR